MTNLVAVPEDGTAEDVLVVQYRAAWVKLDGSRAEWVEATFELAVVVLKLRDRYSANQEFSRWVEHNNLPKMNKDQRAALIWFAENTVFAHTQFEQHPEWGWMMVWRSRPKHRVRRTSNTSTSTPPPPKPRQPKSRPGRKPRLPDVMREDNEGLVVKSSPREPAPERPVVILKGLKPHEVDPDFKGTSLEFITAYGHVNLHTKEQLEEHKRREDESAALGAVADWVRTGEVMEAALAKVDLTAWLSRPAKAEKWEAWCRKGERACSRLRALKG